MRIAVVANTAWNIANFRLGLMRSLRHDGHEVVAMAPLDGHGQAVESEGFEFMDVPISGQGVNPVAEGRTVLRLAQALRAGRVDAAFSYTPKGNLYTALACIPCGRTFVPTVSGLGRAFIRRSLLTHVVQGLYRLTFRHAEYALFQNPDDLELFVSQGFVPRGRAQRVAGSGIDLARFAPRPLPAREGDAPVFLLVARMLWDKGVGEFVAAARQVRCHYPAARFQLLGFLDVANPSAVPRAQMDAWVREGCVEYLGSTADVRDAMAQADCVVLPSYREGIPRTLLEAAAMARPVITTDVPGCRDALIPGTTGLLCEAGSETSLAQAMLDFAGLEIPAREAMGRAGRELMEQAFDERLVHSLYRVIANSIHEQKQHSRARGRADVHASVSGVRAVEETRWQRPY